MMPIRISEERDWPEIVAIYNQAIETHGATADLTPVSVQSRRAWFEAHADPRFPIYVDEASGKIRGWCSVSPYRPGRAALEKTAELSYYVHADFRCKGVATGLIGHAIAGCRGDGFRNVFAILLGGNAASIAVLSKLKFELWGCLPGVAEIDGTEIDHLYFGKKIGA
jgi:phosphinothricin acetyltransferase